MESKKVSIIIINRNKLEDIQTCISSIRKYTSISYEIIVIDNDSTDGSIQWLKSQEEISIISNKKAVSPSTGYNQGISTATGDTIVLLNSDVVVTPNWIENLVKCLFSSDEVGAVGAVTNHCTYQSIQVESSNIEQMIEYAETFNTSNHEKWQETLWLLGFCIIIKASVIKKVGSLDESFASESFEDADYCFRIRKAGFKLMLCSDTFIHNMGSAALKYNRNLSSQIYLSDQKRFIAKWGILPCYAVSVNYDLLKLIDAPNTERITILQAGCFCGADLLHIKNNCKHAELHGIESNECASKIAATIARVISQNIETEDLKYPEHYFDYIIFDGTLNHLLNPWNVLNNIKKHLKPDGKILMSVPNLSHFSVIRNLLNGNWIYEDEGIVSKMNIRFFTLNSIVRILNSSGYKLSLCMGVKYSHSKEDAAFIQAISNLSKSEFTQEYKISHYLIKASLNTGIDQSANENTLIKPKRFVTLFPETENVHLTKDVGMIAYIMHKHFNYDSHIACYKNGEYPYLENEVKGLTIDFIDNIAGDSEEDGKRYLIENAVNIDVLHLFHLCKRTLNWIYIYKQLNPNGKVYLKLDANAYMEKVILNDLIISILNICDLISVETKHLYHYFNKSWSVRVEYIPNGFYDYKERIRVNYKEKENIICTVGRIGSPDKSNEILIEAFKLAYQMLPNWKLKLIGPISDNFKLYITEFFNENSNLKDKIIFIGEINNKSLLNEEYKKAKIFCLTSKMEGFPLVFGEAAKNGCYILSTNIYSAQDITNNQQYGELFNFGDVNKLSEILINICNDENKLKTACNSIQDFVYENFYWVDICRKINGFLN